MPVRRRYIFQTIVREYQQCDVAARGSPALTEELTLKAVKEMHGIINKKTENKGWNIYINKVTSEGMLPYLCPQI